MTTRPLSSHLMVDACRARLAAANAVAAGADKTLAIAAFVNHAFSVYGRGTDEIAADLCMFEADVWNARARTDEYRGQR